MTDAPAIADPPASPQQAYERRQGPDRGRDLLPRLPAGARPRSPRTWASAWCRSARRSAGSRPKGLVTFERNVGATVSGIDPTEYLYTMQTLSIVEGAATALSAPLIGAADMARGPGRQRPRCASACSTSTPSASPG